MYLIQDSGKSKNKESKYLVFTYEDEELKIIDKSNDLKALVDKYNPHKIVNKFFIADKDFDYRN